jgi:beta-lactamase class A
MTDTTKTLQTIEARCGGRLGVAVCHASGNVWLRYREQERFPFCSTVKILIVAAILARVERGQEKLDRPIAYTSNEVLTHAPIAKQNLDKGSLSVEDLCAAALEYSDSAAANLLLEAIGGIAGFNDYARSIGDQTTRLDRMEPDLNEAATGDARDTTTPSAMILNMRRLLLGDALSKNNSRRLESWMQNAKTGLQRLRAGLPADWVVGDRTGTGENGTSNVVAIIRPPNREALLVAIYMTNSTLSGDERDAVIADIGRMIVAWY